jgi:hypothetical protein
VVSACECGNEPPGYLKCGENYRLAEDLFIFSETAPWSYLIIGTFAISESHTKPVNTPFRQK